MTNIAKKITKKLITVAIVVTIVLSVLSSCTPRISKSLEDLNFVSGKTEDEYTETSPSQQVEEIESLTTTINNENNTGLTGNNIVPYYPENAEGDFELSFETNGGQTKPTQTLSVVTSSPTATRSASGVFRYVLDSWYIDRALTQKVIFPYSLTQNVRFYAKWAIAVETPADLKNIDGQMDGDFRLLNDINLTGVEWIPLGLHLAPPDDKGRENTVLIPADGGLVPFTGTFVGSQRDGYGNDIETSKHRLINLSIMPVAEEQQYHYMPYGLFSVVGSTDTKVGTVKNIDIVSARIFLDGGFSRFYIGGIAGKVDGGNIINCSANVAINNPELIYEESVWDEFLGQTFGYAAPTIHTFIGGLVGGLVKGNITNCSSSGVITSASVNEGIFVGGLSGFNWKGTITNSYSTAAVYGKYAGGLLGYNNSIVDACYATGAVSASLAYAALAAGLSAYNDLSGIITRSYATGAVTARTAGGLVAVNIFNYSESSPPNIAGDVIFEAIRDNPGVDASELDEDILAEEKADIVGVGTGGIIKNCFARGTVTGNEYAGGLIGRAESIIPVKGVNSIKSKPLAANSYFIANNFAYGNVTIRATEIAYKNADGVLVISTGVYHAVFAGGLIGHASEIRIMSCIAFGNVTGESRRPVGVGYQYNPAYVGNVIGQCSQVVFGTDATAVEYYIGIVRNIFGTEKQVLRKNAGQDVSYTSLSPIVPFTGSGNNNLSNISYLTTSYDASVDPGLGFDTAIWNFTDVDFSIGRYPSLRG
ncbi:MAG: hypothetical protein LBU04_07055 [Christensenellaceae bacterium]|jgi:hypothetical protein|nr:hypothetical protein [Christensenellaceae bacterium]